MDPISNEDALEILENAPVAHLGVVEGDRPYVTPMSFVYDGERLYFRTMAGRKLEALRENPNVCIEASRYDDETGDWVSVIITGKATETDDDDVKTSVISKLMRKYEKVLGSPLERGGMQPLAGLPHVIVVDVEEISGMSAGRGWSQKTRPGRL